MTNVDNKFELLKNEYFADDPKGFHDFNLHYIDGGNTHLSKSGDKYFIMKKSKHGRGTFRTMREADLPELKLGMLFCAYFRHYSISNDIKTFFTRYTMYRLMRDYNIGENTIWKIAHHKKTPGSMGLDKALEADDDYREHTDSKSVYSRIAQNTPKRIKALLDSTVTTYQIRRATDVNQPSIDAIRRGKNSLGRFALKNAVKLDKFYCQNYGLVKHAVKHRITSAMYRDAHRVIDGATHYRDKKKTVIYSEVRSIANKTGLNKSQIYRLCRGQIKLENSFPKTIYLLSRYYRNNNNK